MTESIIDPFAAPKGKWWPLNKNGVFFLAMLFALFLAWVLCIDYGLALAYVTWVKLSTKEARFGWIIGLLIAATTGSFVGVRYSAHKTIRICLLVMLSIASAVIIIFLVHSDDDIMELSLGIFSIFAEICLILILAFQLRPAIFCSINMTWLFLDAMLLNLAVLSRTWTHLQANPRYLEPVALFTINILVLNPSRFLIKSDFFKNKMVALTGSVEPFFEENSIYTPPRQHEDTRRSLKDDQTRWCGYFIFVSTALVATAFACMLSLPFLDKDLGDIRRIMEMNPKILMVACSSALAFGSTCVGRLFKTHLIVWCVLSALLASASLGALIKLIKEPAEIPFAIILTAFSCMLQIVALFLRELKTTIQTQGWISCAFIFCSFFLPIVAPLVCEYKF